MRALIAAFIACALMLAPAHAQAQLTPEAFRDLAIARIQQRAPQAQVERRDVLGLNVRLPEGAAYEESAINLERAYQEYRGDPSQLDAILDRWARLAADGPENAQARDRVVAILRTPENVAAYENAMRQGTNFSPIVHRPFHGDLVEVLAFDSADSLMFATEAALAEIGLTPDAAWALAPQNLPTRLGPLEAFGVDGANHLGFLTGGNGLTPSTLTDAAICAVDEAPRLFLVLDRNALLVADASDPAARREFAAAVEDLRRNRESMSYTPLGCTNGSLAAVTLTD